MSEAASLIAEICTRMADNIAGQKERLIEDAMKKHFGVDALDIDALAGRLELVTIEGVEGEWYQVDGIPILWIGPNRLERDGSVMTANFNYAQMRG